MDSAFTASCSGLAYRVADASVVEAVGALYRRRHSAVTGGNVDFGPEHPGVRVKRENGLDFVLQSMRKGSRS